MKFIEIDYPTLVRDSQPAVSRLAAFLGSERLPTPEAMTQAIDSKLYRNKQV